MADIQRTRLIGTSPPLRSSGHPRPRGTCLCASGRGHCDPGASSPRGILRGGKGGHHNHGSGRPGSFTTLPRDPLVPKRGYSWWRREQGPRSISRGGRGRFHCSWRNPCCHGNLSARVDCELVDQLREAVYNGDVETTTALIRKCPDLCDITFSDGRRPLILALELQHVALVELLLVKGADPSRLCRFSLARPETPKRKPPPCKVKATLSLRLLMTPLLLAVSASDAHLMYLLMKHGASPDSACTSSPSDLAMFALESKDRDLLEVIVKRHLEDSQSSSWSDSLDFLSPLLQTAVRRRYPDIVRMLIHFGADPDKEYLGKTPLLLAAEQGDMTICKILVDGGASLGQTPRNRSNGHAPLIHSIMHGHHKAFRNLVRLGCDVNVLCEEWIPDCPEEKESCFLKRESPALHCAVYKRSIRCLERLVKAGADLTAIDAEGNSALHLACHDHGQVELLKLLIEVMKAPSKTGSRNLLLETLHMYNSSGMTPLMVASFSGNAEYVKLLLENGAELNMRATGGGLFMGALHFAIDSPSEEALRCLLRYGCDVNQTFMFQLSALHQAIWLGNACFVDILLDHGADITQRCYNGETCLHTAIRASHPELIPQLVQRGALVNQACFSGVTPLIMSTQICASETSHFLMERGALLNSQCKEGYTALMHAIISDAERIFVSLLAEGADLTLSNSRGQTAVDFCIGLNRKAMLHLLMDVGAPFSRDNLHLPFTPFSPTTLAMQQQLLDWLDQKGSIRRLPSVQEVCRTSLRATLLRMSGGTSIKGLVRMLPLPRLLRDYILFQLEITDYFPQLS